LDHCHVNVSELRRAITSVPQRRWRRRFHFLPTRARSQCTAALNRAVVDSLANKLSSRGTRLFFAQSRDVLKVGHHGSAYASTPEFIAAVHPHAAIISVGRHNTFGHPAPSTLKTLALAGAQIYRTDRCGAATFTANQDLTTMLYCKP
jgi:hypothetical protein